MRADLRPFADHGHVAMGNDAALVGDQAAGMGQELVGGGTAPALVGRREMLADIAGADGAQDGIGQRMEPDIGIGMAEQRLVMRDLEPVDPAPVAQTRRRSDPYFFEAKGSEPPTNAAASLLDAEIARKEPG